MTEEINNSQAITAPVLEDTPALSVEQLKAVMPTRQKQNITQSLVDELNHLMVEPEYREYFRNNIISYCDVLQDPNTTITGYIKAVKYVSYKLMGFTNQNSWVKTFPERYQRLCDEKKSADYLRSLVAAYNKGQMVNRILEQTMVPTWVLNADLFQKALNQQLVLMQTARSEKVRSEAADSLLRHLKRPDAAKLELDIAIKQDDSVQRLTDAMSKLVDAQRKSIEQGHISVVEVAESNIIDITSEGEVVK
jgi:hypothetical protein